MSTLEQLAADLAYAAGPGAARLAASTARSGREQAELGVAIGAPGPGLRAVLAQHGGTAHASSPAQNASTAAIADHMAAELLDGGAALLQGHR